MVMVAGRAGLYIIYLYVCNSTVHTAAVAVARHARTMHTYMQAVVAQETKPQGKLFI